jgi:hypothetical protein
MNQCFLETDKLGTPHKMALWILDYSPALNLAFLMTY